MDQAAWKTAVGAARECVGCGACMQVCPVYRAGRREDLSARGKLRLLQALAQGPLTPSRRFGEILSREVLASVAGAPLLLRLMVDEALPHEHRGPPDL